MSSFKEEIRFREILRIRQSEGLYSVKEQMELIISLELYILHIALCCSKEA
jgi:hypothetical protein